MICSVRRTGLSEHSGPAKCRLDVQETAFDQGSPCLLLILEVILFASSNIFYSIFRTVQVLIVLHGVHDITWVCLFGQMGLQLIYL